MRQKLFGTNPRETSCLRSFQFHFRFKSIKLRLLYFRSIFNTKLLTLFSDIINIIKINIFFTMTCIKISFLIFLYKRWSIWVLFEEEGLNCNASYIRGQRIIYLFLNKKLLISMFHYFKWMVSLFFSTFLLNLFQVFLLYWN